MIKSYSFLTIFNYIIYIVCISPSVLKFCFNIDIKFCFMMIISVLCNMGGLIYSLIGILLFIIGLINKAYYVKKIIILFIVNILHFFLYFAVTLPLVIVPEQI